MSLQNLLCHFPLFMESVMESGSGLPSKDKEFLVILSLYRVPCGQTMLSFVSDLVPQI